MDTKFLLKSTKMQVTPEPLTVKTENVTKSTIVTLKSANLSKSFPIQSEALTQESMIKKPENLKELINNSHKKPANLTPHSVHIRKPLDLTEWVKKKSENMKEQGVIKSENLTKHKVIENTKKTVSPIEEFKGLSEPVLKNAENLRKPVIIVKSEDLTEAVQKIGEKIKGSFIKESKNLPESVIENLNYMTERVNKRSKNSKSSTKKKTKNVEESVGKKSKSPESKNRESAIKKFQNPESMDKRSGTPKPMVKSTSSHATKMETSTTEKPTCPHCQKQFSRAFGLRRHLLLHNDLRPLSCSLCPFKTKRNDILLQHLRRVHSDLRPYACHLCPYKSKTKSNLTGHHHQVHRPKRIPCPFPNCALKFSCHTHLATHQRVHTGERPFECQLCPFRAAKMSNIYAHLTHRHTKERPYRCEFCHKTFSSNSSHIDHIRTHTGEKPYKCAYCDYACTKSDVLTVHERRHTGEKPYKCGFCDYSCVANSMLKSHMQSHERAATRMRVKCDILHCKFSAYTKTALNLHVLTHTRGGKFQCKFCKFPASSAAFLRKHLERKHCPHCGFLASETRLLKKHVQFCSGKT